MPISIPSSLVEFILLGPMDDRRQLQDSPILADVWVEFGKQPDKAVDLLIAPYRGHNAGTVATEIHDGLRTKEDAELEDEAGSANEDNEDADEEDANIAFLQGLIVARLKFEQVMRVVAPKTKWWINRRPKEDDVPITESEKAKPDAGQPKTTAVAMHDATDNPANLKEILKSVLDVADKWHSERAVGPSGKIDKIPSPLNRLLALTALIYWAGSHPPEEESRSPKPKKQSRSAKPKKEVRSPEEQITYVLKEAKENLERMSQMLSDLAEEMWENSPDDKKPRVWQVSLNRSAMPAISKSIPAVKADAATYLFKVNCSDITWAVVDSGIDSTHPAFKDKDGKGSRVKKSYDFKNFRRIVSISNLNRSIRKANIKVLKKDDDYLVHPVVDDAADRELETLAKDAVNRGSVHWELVEKYVQIKPGTPTQTGHGTHVAGILGASKRASQEIEEQAVRIAEMKIAGEAVETATEKGVAETIMKAVHRVAETTERRKNPDFADGMCPDISLYDFRVLGSNIKDAEFAIIAALQFIRYLNSRDNFLAIHGANLSLSIPHDVRNFACGRTPICEECERLVSSGVVVVAAAGNHGYKSYETNEGSYNSYAAFSITDPGNADSVITVGATHRFWPHTYGVSFFSSRGPTGDGRMKPDLVAPGERIRAPLPDNHDLGGNWGDLDGTSMAAPHVSGAAAMLMARYSELIGQPHRIKRILCESATDLARERSFQGHGMLDVLRAFQSI